MMYRIRQKIAQGDLAEVYKSRFPDASSQVQEAAIRSLLRNRMELRSPFSAGRPLFSQDSSNHLRNLQMVSFGLNVQSNELEGAVDRMFLEQNGYLSDILSTIDVAEDLLSEVQVQVLENYSSVKINSFGLSEDMEIGPALESDPKTGQPVAPERNARPTKGVGILQASRGMHSVAVEDAYIDSALSTREYVIDSDSPLNLLSSDKVFNQIIGVSEEYNSFANRKTEATLVVGFQLEHVQDVNMMNIEPLGSVAFRITKLEYKNILGTWTNIPIPNQEIANRKTIIFSKVAAGALRVTLSQTASERRKFTFGKEPVNDLLEKSEFQYRVEENVTEFQGAIFDFSIKTINFKLAAYFPEGYYQGPKFPIDNAYGISVKDDWNGSGYVERYMYMRLEENGSIVHDKIVPMPDYDYYQKEVLFPNNSVCRVKLFPQLDANLGRKRVTSISTNIAFLANTLTVNTYKPHALNVSDTVSFYNLGNTGLSGSYVVTAVPTTTSFEFEDSSIVNMDGEELPYMYAYKNTSVPAGFSVFQGSTLLTLGTDYQYSLDGGSTWQTTYIYELSNLTIEAGKFLIKLTSPNVASKYHVRYYYHPLQRLDSTGGVMLRNRVIELEEGLKGYVRPVFVLRSISTDVYNTLNLTSYWLKTKAR